MNFLLQNAYVGRRARTSMWGTTSRDQGSVDGAEPDMPLDQRILPKEKLKELLTRDKVQDVLDCRCASCTSRIERPMLTHSIPLRDTIFGIGGPEIYTCASDLILFALLIYIECPQFTVSFVQRSGTEDVASCMFEYQQWE
jgi:hypothetical protein